MHEEMRVRRRFDAEPPAECQQLLDMRYGRRDCAGAFLDHIVKAEFKLLMLAEAAEYLGDRPLGVEDGQDVTDARPAMAG